MSALSIQDRLRGHATGLKWAPPHPLHGQVAMVLSEAADMIDQLQQPRLCPTCDANRRCNIQITLRGDDPRIWDLFDEFGCSLWRAQNR